MQCGAGLGETLEPVRLIAVSQRYSTKDEVAERPRDVRRCHACRWFNIFIPLAQDGKP